jgi:hypothetical protein
MDEAVNGVDFGEGRRSGRRSRDSRKRPRPQAAKPARRNRPGTRSGTAEITRGGAAR